MVVLVVLVVLGVLGEEEACTWRERLSKPRLAPLLPLFDRGFGLRGRLLRAGGCLAQQTACVCKREVGR